MIKALAAGAAVLTLLWLFLRWFESVNLYAPDLTLTAHPGSYGLAYEELALEGGLHGWFIPHASTSPVVLVCHGNGGNISHRLDKLMIFRRAAASVLLFDYRGYGRSPGRPHEEGLYKDAETAYDWLRMAKGVPPSRIVFYGESLGGAVALELALRRAGAGLILDSSFTSTVEMGKRIFPFLPVEWMVRQRFDNIAKIGRVKVPVLVMHSPQDDIVPFDMGRALFSAAPQPKRFFEMKGNHNDGFLDSEPAYGEAITDFLRTLR